MTVPHGSSYTQSMQTVSTNDLGIYSVVAASYFHNISLHCVQKKETKRFVLRYLIRNSGDYDKNFYTVAWINLLHNKTNVFHLTWIMSLHYLVKLEMLIAHVLPLSCYRKKLQNSFHFNCVPKFPDLNPIEYSMWELLQEKCKNTHHWSERTETATVNGVDHAGSCRHCCSHSSVASLIAPDQLWVFWTPSLAIFPTCCYQLDSNLANLEDTVEVE